MMFFSDVSVDELTWSKRYPRIIQRIQSLNPDLICLQEVEPEVFESFCRDLGQFEGIKFMHVMLVTYV